MFAYAAIPLTCWLCALLALPRKPLPGNEVQELVYSRLLGRQSRLVVLALVLTAGALLAGIATLPQRADPALTAARRVRAYCDLTAAHRSVCYHLQADGTWLEARRQSDARWSVVGTVLVPADEPSPAPAGSLSSDDERAARNRLATPVSGIPTCDELQADGRSRDVEMVVTLPPRYA